MKTHTRTVHTHALLAALLALAPAPAALPAGLALLGFTALRSRR